MQQKYEELKQSFDKVVDMGYKYCPDIDRRETEKFLLSITFRIWSHNVYYTDEYGEAIKVLQNTPYTIEQITTAMACCGEKERNVKVPAILQKTEDIKARKSILNCIGDYLAAAAMINGDFTLGEAGCWSEIMFHISDNCLGEEAKNWVFRFKPHESITELNETGYYKTSKYAASNNEKKSSGGWWLDDETGRKKMSYDDGHTDYSSYEDEDEDDSSEDLVDSLVNAITMVNTLNTLNTLNSLNAANGTEQKTKDKVENAKVSKPVNQSLNKLLEELDSLVGLDKVKKDVYSLMNFIKVANMRKEKGMKVPAISYHLVFTGNPGTGKTTIARLIAQIYYKMGLLTKGQLVETDRSALVAGYLGQTAIKTQKVIQEALGGVLFIDEAYSLAGDEDDSYGKEAIETLLKTMEDNRDDLVVIVAGYDELMHKFIDSNPGLRSRFNKFFHFPDYTGSELVKIFERFCETNGYAINQEVSEVLLERFNQVYENREEHFGNARAVRNTFETAICHQANRLAVMPEVSDEALINLSIEDVQLALEEEFGC